MNSGGSAATLGSACSRSKSMGTLALRDAVWGQINVLNYTRDTAL